jgi:large subunit ribosomal protein L7/L12
MIEMADINKLIDDLSGMTVLEIVELTKALEDRWGVKAAAAMPMMAMPMGAAAAGAAPAAAAEPVEEKTEFNVILKEAGPKKIEVIKTVRALLTNLSLKDAKDMVEGAPKLILEGVTKEVAEDAKKKFEEVGAAVELQ